MIVKLNFFSTSLFLLFLSFRTASEIEEEDQGFKLPQVPSKRSKTATSEQVPEEDPLRIGRSPPQPGTLDIQIPPCPQDELITPEGAIPEQQYPNFIPTSITPIKNTDLGPSEQPLLIGSEEPLPKRSHSQILGEVQSGWTSPNVEEGE